MKEFKVGDEVRVVPKVGYYKYHSCTSNEKLQGKVGIVYKVDDAPSVCVDFDGDKGNWFAFDEVELNTATNPNPIVVKETTIIIRKHREVKLSEIITHLTAIKDEFGDSTMVAAIKSDGTFHGPDRISCNELILDIGHGLTTFGDRKIEKMFFTKPVPKLTPEQIKIKELKATIEKAREEVAALERSF